MSTACPPMQGLEKGRDQPVQSPALDCVFSFKLQAERNFLFLGTQMTRCPDPGFTTASVL